MVAVQWEGSHVWRELYLRGRRLVFELARQGRQAAPSAAHPELGSALHAAQGSGCTCRAFEGSMHAGRQRAQAWEGGMRGHAEAGAAALTV